jgi:hypothetical protein
MQDLSLVYTYYNNPLMFLRQVEEWESYPEAIKERLKVYITDDCSTEKPLKKVLQFPEKIEGHGYYITKKAQWNWIAGRNIGAYNADTKWLLLTDVDHIVSKESIIKIFNQLDSLNPNSFYFFTRQDANGVVMKNHSNSYLITKELFWKIGGYDENLSGLYYGTLCAYHIRAFSKVRYHPVLDIPLTFFDLKDVLDANSGSSFVRNKAQDCSKLRKIMHTYGSLVKVMSFPYIKL